MIIRGNPIITILAFFIISILIMITSASFLIWFFSIIIVLLIYSIRAYYFIIKDEKIIVKHFIFFWIHKEFEFSEIEKIIINDNSSYGLTYININNNKYAIGGRSLEYVQKRFETLKEKGVNVIVKSSFF